MAQSQTPSLSAEEQVMVQIDRESGYRRLIGPWAWAVSFLGIGLALFHLYTAAFAPLPPQLQRAPHLGIALGMIFLLYPAKRGDIKPTVPWYDLLLALAGLGTAFYHVYFYIDLINMAGMPGLLDLVVAAIGTALVLEATRRVAGWAMVAVAGSFLAYALWGGFLPGVFSHRGYSLETVLEHTFLGLEGIYSTPIGVSATVIFVYLIFAQFLGKTGIRQLFVDLSMALTGHTPGGPAKVAVVSSAFEGTISGSSIANVAGAGSFTIPMMKGLGYRKEFAAAVEAAASTGGQIMPPIMGAAAFVMVEFLNIPYITIAKAAAIPALLYFTAVFIMVHFEAKKTGLTGLPREQLPRLGQVLLRQGYLAIPLVAIFWMMDAGYSPARAAVFSIGLAWLFGLIRKETRMGLRQILRTLEDAARASLAVIAACATAGIVVGVVTLTGVGLKLSANMIDLAGNNLWIALVLTMLASIVLGMGLPTTATYIVLATMAAPALTKMGVEPLAAHLFVFYFGILADITPPVSLAVYAGSAIAGSNPWKTGIEAVKIALGAFLIPFIFVTSPEMLLIGATWEEVLKLLFTSLLGMTALGTGVTGYWTTHLMRWERGMLIAGGILLVDPNLTTDLVGGTLVAVAFGLQYLRSRQIAGSMAA